MVEQPLRAFGPAKRRKCGAEAEAEDGVDREEEEEVKGVPFAVARQIERPGKNPSSTPPP